METVRRKQLVKNNSVFGSWWDGNIWWFLHRLSIRRLMQDNAGRRAFPTFFKKDRILHFMTFNFENAASHIYAMQKSKRLRVTTSDMTGHSFLVFTQKWDKLCFENSSCKTLWLIIRKFVWAMTRVWPPEISIVYHRRNQGGGTVTITA